MKWFLSFFVDFLSRVQSAPISYIFLFIVHFDCEFWSVWFMVFFHNAIACVMNIIYIWVLYLGFPGGSDGKNLPAMQETSVWSLGWKDPLEKGMATHSSILTWKIPWTEEPGGLQSIGLQKVGHNWATNTLTFILVLLFCAFLFFIFPLILCVVSVFRRFGFSFLLSYSNSVWMLPSFFYWKASALFFLDAAIQ